ncbi:hypothetical protein PFRA20S_00997 [Pseudomonas fragi]|nr:hypothetical protein SAMN05216594_2656 [Pseudomonas fragi]
MINSNPVAAAEGCDGMRSRPVFLKALRAFSQPVGSGYRLSAALWMLLLLSACTSLPLPRHTPTLALPMQLHIQRQQADQRQDWLLVIQQQDTALRWSLMDPLGIPLARQLLQDGSWHADGLLPPNPEARELFAALLFALTPATQLADNYPQAKTAPDLRFIEQRWQVHYPQPEVFRIDMKGDLHYTVSPLETAP